MKSLYSYTLFISRPRKEIHGMSYSRESLIFYMQVNDKAKPRSKLVLWSYDEQDASFRMNPQAQQTEYHAAQSGEWKRGHVMT